MEYSPPPLFKQGAPARVKVTVFACISIALLMFDSRFAALATVRLATATVLYPLQMAALVPRDLFSSMGSYFTSLTALQKQLHELRSTQVATALSMQQAQLQMAENVQLRKLLGAQASLPVPTMMTEILYDARDPATRKIVINRGSQRDVRLGLPVIDGAGVVGQVTRVFPFTSEVTLLTDKEQAIPVQVLRTGLRTVAYGRGQSGLLDLRFVAPNADILVGDVLITSGMDGVYPAGLAVAKVVKVENSAAGAFGGVLCQPLAGVDRHRQLLVLMALPQVAQRPPEESVKPLKKSTLTKMTPLTPAGAPAVVPPVAPALIAAPAAGAAGLAVPVPGPRASGALAPRAPRAPLVAPVDRPVTTAPVGTVPSAIPPGSPAPPPTATPRAPAQ